MTLSRECSRYISLAVVSLGSKRKTNHFKHNDRFEYSVKSREASTGKHSKLNANGKECNNNKNLYWKQAVMVRLNVSTALPLFFLVHWEISHEL